MAKLEARLDALWESFLTKTEEIERETGIPAAHNPMCQALWKSNYEAEYEQISAKLMAM